MFGNEIKYRYILLDDESYKEYDIDKFHCDDKNGSIEYYLKKTALKDYYNNKAVTKLIINVRTNKIIGFYALSTTALIFNTSTKIQYLPSMEIKFFALDKEYQGLKYDDNEDDDGLNNFSNMIFFDILDLIRNLSEYTCGIHNIILYSVPKAYNFYYRHGFRNFTEYMIRDEGKYIKDCIPMYMKL